MKHYLANKYSQLDEESSSKNIPTPSGNETTDCRKHRSRKRLESSDLSDDGEIIITEFNPKLRRTGRKTKNPQKPEVVNIPDNSKQNSAAAGSGVSQQDSSAETRSHAMTNKI